MDWTKTQPELRPEGVFGVSVEPGRTRMTQKNHSCLGALKSKVLQNAESRGTKSSIWP